MQQNEGKRHVLSVKRNFLPNMSRQSIGLDSPPPPPEVNPRMKMNLINTPYSCLFTTKYSTKYSGVYCFTAQEAGRTEQRCQAAARPQGAPSPAQRSCSDGTRTGQLWSRDLHEA